MNNKFSSCFDAILKKKKFTNTNLGWNGEGKKGVYIFRDPGMESSLLKYIFGAF